MAPTTRSTRASKETTVANDSGLNDDVDTIPSTSTTLEMRANKKSTGRSNNDKVYRKAPSAPEPEQVKFPARRKTIRQKKATRQSLPASLTRTSSSTARNERRIRKEKGDDPKQSTLTQIGWVPSSFPDDMLDDDDNDDEPGARLLVDLTGLSGDEEEEWNGFESSLEPFAKNKMPGKDKHTKKPNKGRKRRKTTGDLELEREEDEEQEEEVRSSSRFYTQTLTQMPSWRQSEEGGDGGHLLGMVEADPDGEPDNISTRLGAEIGDGADGYSTSPWSKKRKRPSPPPIQAELMQNQQKQAVSPSQQSTTSAPAPATPRAQRLIRAEIPSSQPSPFTPNLEISRRYWSPLNLQRQGVERTPLKEKSTNVEEPTPSANGRVPPQLRKERSEVPDSWSTVNGGLGSSPVRASDSSQIQRVKRTPLKEIHFADVSLELGEHGAETEGQEGGAPSQVSSRPEEEVILDSDEEFQIFDDGDHDVQDEPQPAGTPEPVVRLSDQLIGEIRTPTRAPRSSGQVIDDAGVQDAETVNQPTPGNTARQTAPLQEIHSSPAEEYSAEVADVGAEHRPLKEHISSSLPSKSPSRPPVVEVVASGTTPTSPVRKSAAKKPPSRLGLHRPSTPEPPVEDEDETEPETPTHRRRRPSSSSAVEKETPLSSPQKTSPAMPPVSQLGYRSQAFESQRVPFEIIRQMAPQTDRSDVIMSIHPEHVEEIVDGAKTHEFRNFRLHQVARIWIYITHPVCELKYMAVISGYKLPGEISADDPGVGNKAFNEGKGSKYAYELLQVYQLNNPVSLNRMKENGWVEQAPQKFKYVPPAVLGQLMGNLRCALFEEREHEAEEDAEGDANEGGATISQELAQQLRSDIEGATQLVRGLPSSPQDRSQPHEDMKEHNMDATVQSSQDAAGGGHITSTPPRRVPGSQRQVVSAELEAPLSRSQGSDDQIDDSPPAVVRHVEYELQQVVESTVRPSQATTASAVSQSQRILSQQAGTQNYTPARRPHMEGSSSLPSLPEDIMFVDDSPVQARTAGEKSDLHTQSSLGLGMLLRSSQGVGLGAIGDEEDSLMDDSRIRLPPTQGEVVWDSEGEE